MLWHGARAHRMAHFQLLLQTATPSLRDTMPKIDREAGNLGPREWQREEREKGQSETGEDF